MTKYCQNLKVERSTTVKFKKFSKTLALIGLAMYLVVAIGAYLSEVNYITTKGFYQRDLESQIAELRDSNEKLQSKVVEMKSTTDLSEKIQGLNMVKVDQITYFDTTGQTVARR
ncbi:MAG: hypothetical protein AAB766_01380 [Patescibacteria group bacterium]